MAAGGHFEKVVLGDLCYKAVQNVDLVVLGVNKSDSEVNLTSWPGHDLQIQDNCHKKIQNGRRQPFWESSFGWICHKAVQNAYFGGFRGQLSDSEVSVTSWPGRDLQI